jgi:hypothetical protein
LGVVTGIVAAASIGYVLWTLRGSSSWASVFCAVRLWSGFDPSSEPDLAARKSWRKENLSHDDKRQGPRAADDPDR